MAKPKPGPDGIIQLQELSDLALMMVALSALLRESGSDTDRLQTLLSTRAYRGVRG